MRKFLLAVFSIIFLGMLAITVYASLDRSVFNVGRVLLSDRWFQATLLDAYFGFITFYVWVATKESKTWLRIVWFILIMTLGNMAMAAYMLIQLFRRDESQGWAGLWLRSP